MTGAGALPGAIAGLGQVMQLAFVPADIEAATAFWTGTMGVGPFFVLQHVKLDNLHYRGAPADIDFSIRIAYWGDMQIELVEQHNDAASIFREPAAQHGLHHVCMVVDDMARGAGALHGGGARRGAGGARSGWRRSHLRRYRRRPWHDGGDASGDAWRHGVLRLRQAGGA